MVESIKSGFIKPTKIRNVLKLEDGMSQMLSMSSQRQSVFSQRKSVKRMSQTKSDLQIKLKGKDCGNRRYTASQISSMIGGVLSRLHAKDSDSAPTEATTPVDVNLEDMLDENPLNDDNEEITF